MHEALNMSAPGICIDDWLSPCLTSQQINHYEFIARGRADLSTVSACRSPGL
jgi:hypothetical protein